jgi:hypothetical protein
VLFWFNVCSIVEKHVPVAKNKLIRFYLSFISFGFTQSVGRKV